MKRVSTGDFPFYQRAARRIVGVRCVPDVGNHCLGIAAKRLLEGAQRTGESGPGKERIVDGAVGQVQRQRQVHVVAPHQLRHGVDVKGLGEDQFERTHQIRSGSTQFLERALQRLQVLVQIAPGSRKILVGGLAEPAYRIGSVDQQFLLIRKVLDQWR